MILKKKLNEENLAEEYMDTQYHADVYNVLTIKKHVLNQAIQISKQNTQDFDSLS